MKLLLHCCCAPCATACVDSLKGSLAAGDIASETDYVPTLFWYNPNIHPLAEYHKRRDALLAFVSMNKLPLESIDECGSERLLQDIGTETPGELHDRPCCEMCYRLLLEKTAACAAQQGFDAISTTLLISPYQKHDMIRRLGEELAGQYGLVFLYRDFRPLFRESQAQARALGLYMQKYCGCAMSIQGRQ